MMVLLVRNKVKDFHRWKRVFDAQAGPAREAVLVLTRLWRAVDHTDEVFFTFDVEDRPRAESFMRAPRSVAAGAESGVIDGDYPLLTPVT